VGDKLSDGLISMIVFYLISFLVLVPLIVEGHKCGLNVGKRLMPSVVKSHKNFVDVIVYNVLACNLHTDYIFISLYPINSKNGIIK